MVSWDDKHVSLFLCRSGRLLAALAAAKGLSHDPRVKKALARGHCGCFFVRLSLPNFGIFFDCRRDNRVCSSLSPWRYRL